MIEQRLEAENSRYLRRQGYPWYVLFCVSVAVALLLQFAFIPGMEYTVVQTEENSVLEKELNTFISTTKFEDLVFDKVLLTSWDLKARQPFVLTTQTVRDQAIYKPYDDLRKATLLSAACPEYFKPVEDGDRIFIGGDAMAVSPAMLAFLLATEEGRKDGTEIKPEEIEVFSIGSVNERADRIPDDIGALDWLSRLDSLQGASKMHTQDYLLHHILEHHGTSLKKYAFSMSYKSS